MATPFGRGPSDDPPNRNHPDARLVFHRRGVSVGDGMSTKTCPTCGHEELVADRASVHGMYDAHLFHSIEGAMVDDIIAAWRDHNASPNPATVGGRDVDDLGKSALCPVIVLAGSKELRRVGPMVFPTDDRGYHTPEREAEEVAKWRTACLDDADIVRLLAERNTP